MIVRTWGAGILRPYRDKKQGAQAQAYATAGPFEAQGMQKAVPTEEKARAGPSKLSVNDSAPLEEKKQEHRLKPMLLSAPSKLRVNRKPALQSEVQEKSRSFAALRMTNLL
jgi:hypothetical protein